MVTATMKLKDTFFWKESYDNLDSILKSRDITLPTVVHMVKVMVFPVVMYGCWVVHIVMYGFSSSHVCTEELVLSNCGIQETLESSLDSKEI